MWRLRLRPRSLPQQGNIEVDAPDQGVALTSCSAGECSVRCGVECGNRDDDRVLLYFWLLFSHFYPHGEVRCFYWSTVQNINWSEDKHMFLRRAFLCLNALH